MIWKMLVLGVLQGLTEFLPVSSSGHLVLAQDILGIDEARLAGTVFLHFGTLLAVIVFFARRLWKLVKSPFVKNDEQKPNLKMILWIIIGTIPAAIVGLVAKDYLETVFDNAAYVPFFLIGTGVMLLITRWAKDRGQSIRLSDALIIGIAQAAAILPGLSRSGLTISTALLLGIASAEAFEFSFLLSLPAVLAANILELKDVTSFGEPLAVAIGVAASFGVGLFALWALRKVVISKKFWLFSFYCFAIGIVGIIFYLFLR